MYWTRWIVYWRPKNGEPIKLTNGFDSRLPLLLPGAWICKQQRLTARLLSAVRLKNKKTALNKWKSSNWTENPDSCTICMTWTSQERNEARSFKARSTCVYLRQGSALQGTHTQISDQNGIDPGPDWSWGAKLPKDWSTAFTTPMEFSHYVNFC